MLPSKKLFGGTLHNMSNPPTNLCMVQTHELELSTIILESFVTFVKFSHSEIFGQPLSHATSLINLIIFCSLLFYLCHFNSVLYSEIHFLNILCFFKVKDSTPILSPFFFGYLVFFLLLMKNAFFAIFFVAFDCSWF